MHALLRPGLLSLLVESWAAGCPEPWGGAGSRVAVCFSALAKNAGAPATAAGMLPTALGTSFAALPRLCESAQVPNRPFSAPWAFSWETDAPVACSVAGCGAVAPPFWAAMCSYFVCRYKVLWSPRGLCDD